MTFEFTFTTDIAYPDLAQRPTTDAVSRAREMAVAKTVRVPKVALQGVVEYPTLPSLAESTRSYQSVPARSVLGKRRTRTTSTPTPPATTRKATELYSGTRHSSTCTTPTPTSIRKTFLRAQQTATPPATPSAAALLKRSTTPAIAVPLVAPVAAPVQTAASAAPPAKRRKKVVARQIF